MTPKPPDDSRDEKILGHLTRSMSGWSEACSIAHGLNSNEATILIALRRLELDGKVQHRSVRRMVDSRPVTEWAVRS